MTGSYFCRSFTQYNIVSLDLTSSRFSASFNTVVFFFLRKASIIQKGNCLGPIAASKRVSRFNQLLTGILGDVCGLQQGDMLSGSSS